MTLRLYVFAFCLFLLAPVLVVVYVSFSASPYVQVPVEAFSLRWFYRVWEYAPFRDALITSIELAVIAGVASTLLTLPAALAVRSLPSNYAAAVEGMILSPLAVPYIVIGCAALFYFSAIGLGLSFIGLVLAHIVVSVPYTFRTCLSVYRSMPAGMEEAARSLGASKLRTFLFVTLPIIRPGVFSGFTFAALISLDNLPVSFFFGTPETNTLPVVMLSYLENQFDPSIAALSTVQMLIAIGCLVLVDRTFGIQKLIDAR
ncbi:ABC transporter permease [Mesorhizobium sp. B2-6-5]|uniref:ABC transporter permease n=1 Tax=Mesorhizobium sp. B2-6-5 TaxID=2589912 RepID=UPI00112E75F4|nr:ABC transporter permease [Mesorhizobium sp. B2-6-5]TPJ38276.1 ABC transporter permease [Mesorhizobium sp. B2-6-5]